MCEEWQKYFMDFCIILHPSEMYVTLQPSYNSIAGLMQDRSKTVAKFPNIFGDIEILSKTVHTKNRYIMWQYVT